MFRLWPIVLVLWCCLHLCCLEHLKAKSEMLWPVRWLPIPCPAHSTSWKRDCTSQGYWSLLALKDSQWILMIRPLGPRGSSMNLLKAWIMCSCHTTKCVIILFVTGVSVDHSVFQIRGCKGQKPDMVTRWNDQLNSTRVVTWPVRKYVEGKTFFKVREKSGNFILSQGKYSRFEEKLWKIEIIWHGSFNMYHWRLEETFGVTVISTIFVLNEEGKLNSCLLLDLAFCIYSIREILFLSGKSRGILKSDFCGDHEFTWKDLERP